MPPIDIHRFAFLAVSISAVGICQPAPRTPPRWMVNYDESKQKPSRENALLSRLAKVKEIWEDQHGNVNDPNYLWVYGNSENMLPILIDCIKSNKRMKFPYSMPTPSQFTVGDLAFYLLCDWGYLDFEQTITPFVDPVAYKDRGYLAYFDWVQIPGHRELLFQSVQTALKSKLPAQ